MKKISEVIRDLVSKQPFLEEALSFWFLNLTAFAEYIQPYIEKEAKKTVSIHAIKMALSRMDIPLEITPWNYGGFQKISTRMGLSIMTIARSPKNISLITHLMLEKQKRRDHFFTIIEWVHEIDIIFETKDTDLLHEKIPQTLQILIVSGLWLISCELSDKEISTPWLFYRVTKKLAFYDINIIQVLSTYHELGVIMAEGDIKRGVNILLD